MNGIAVSILMLSALVAAANGANDVSKGVATLAGAGVTRYRSAIAWGVITTLAGSLLSLAMAGPINRLFSRGIVDLHPSASFTLAVLAGAAAWILFATAMRLPVSTTHAVVGALVGAALFVGPQTVLWRSLLFAVAVPLLASIAVAYALSAALNVTLNGLARSRLGWRPGPGAMLTEGVQRELSAAHSPVDHLHWLTSGATSLARGLNDTPKIFAVGAFTLVPGHLSATQLLIIVAGSMAVGGLVAGVRVAHRLGEGLLSLSHSEGFRSNLAAAVLVAAGAHFGLPMSTTHVSTAAIAGAARLNVARWNARTLRDFVLAWTLTPAVAAFVALAAFGALRQLG